jgi:hypothetical protein
MGKKIKAAILLICVYLLVFWVGFKSGSMYLRMQQKAGDPKVAMEFKQFYLVETNDYGTYSNVSFRKADANTLEIEMFMNEKLRPLLKLRDIKIYKETGERVY